MGRVDSAGRLDGRRVAAVSYYYTDPATGCTRVSDEAPPCEWLETPEEQAEYNRVKENHLTFGYDLGKTIEECQAAYARSLRPHPQDSCRVCKGDGYLRDEAGIYDCYGCSGTGGK